MHFVSSLTIIPFYYLIKSLSSKTVALRATFLWALIPSFTFFPLFFDPLYTIFPIVSFFILVNAYKRRRDFLYFLGGLIFSIGLFFTFSILPLLLFLLVLVFLFKVPQKIIVILTFLLGMLIPPLFFLLCGYNSLESGLVILNSQTPRSYIDWLIFNPYDFFLFMGLPLSFIFLFSTFKIFKDKKLANLKKITFAFYTMFSTLIILGVSRGEVGRIWIPLMFIPIGILSYYLPEKLKFKTGYFVVLIVLLIIQAIVLEEFWVPIW
jgi:hypothetical protein